MKQLIIQILFAFAAVSMFSCSPKRNPYWGDGIESFEIQQIFDSERFPNITATNEGTILAVWGGISQHHGEGSLRVRRSEDGGTTWQPAITVVDSTQWSGGGVVVDETTGDIIIFSERGELTEEHPAGKLSVYRSTDDGKTWQPQPITIYPDKNGNMPSMHMNERGITLKYGPNKGRLIRAARYYGQGNDRQFWAQHYTNAIYSDDGGYTWHTSDPFPARGTGEATIEELSDGTLYYNSRIHFSDDGRNPKMRHIARSLDGGQTWQDLYVSDVLPDGNQDTEYGLMAGLVRLPIDDHDILLYSNIESDSGRKNGTVWASFDGGKTWPVKRVADEGGFAYSSMTAGKTGTPSEGYIYLLYEDAGHPHAKGLVARFNLPWLTEGRDWKEFLPENK